MHECRYLRYIYFFIANNCGIQILDKIDALIFSVSENNVSYNSIHSPIPTFMHLEDTFIQSDFISNYDTVFFFSGPWRPFV